MRVKLLSTSILCLMLVACASTGPAQRTKLTREEVKEMGPELVAHRRCMAKKVVAYAGSGSSVETMVNAAKQGCRNKLVPVVGKLKNFNLTPRARAKYLNAVERTASVALTDAVLKASANSRRKKRSTQRGTML